MKANVTARPIPCARNSSRLLPLPTLLIMFIYFSFLFERERLNGMLSCRLVVCFVRIETSALGLRSLSLCCHYAQQLRPVSPHLEFE
jgi:hypothetical protein